jgi:hypothetical protein
MKTLLLFAARLLAVAFPFQLMSSAEVNANNYDPMIVDATSRPAQLDLTVHEIPWMLMTGTKDLAPIGNADMKSRLAVYQALHGAAKYEVVLHNAEHSVFTDRRLPGDREPRNPNHHRVILALSTAFWDAYLRGDTAALAWLNGHGPRSVMETEDQWQFEAR